jgi:5-methylcytosine-specific restriction enzyme subunit McrC
MKTLRLKEWSPQQVQLTNPELVRLLSVPKILTLTPRDPRSGIYSVRPGSVVGTLVWPELRVLIKPKVELENVFFLLGFRGGLAEWGTEGFPYEGEWDFLRAIAWAFRAEMERGLRYGISRSYQEKSEVLAGFRGRLDVGRQTTTWQGRPFPAECRFVEYGEDNLLNRVLRAANARLLAAGGLNFDLVRSLQYIASELAMVDEVQLRPSQVPDVAFTRLNAQWEPAFRLARLILTGETLRDETGTAVGTSFTVDMNALFEKFVEEVVAEEAWRRGWELEPQFRVGLTERVRMKPDLVLLREGEPVAVADAKYVELDEGWPHANVYQLLAYCVALGLPRGLLIYASQRKPEVQRVRGSGTELEIVGIDMSKPSDSLVEEARFAARRLMAHARAAGGAQIGARSPVVSVVG